MSFSKIAKNSKKVQSSQITSLAQLRGQEIVVEFEAEFVQLGLFGQHIERHSVYVADVAFDAIFVDGVYFGAPTDEEVAILIAIANGCEYVM